MRKGLTGVREAVRRKGHEISDRTREATSRPILGALEEFHGLFRCRAVEHFRVAPARRTGSGPVTDTGLGAALRAFSLRVRRRPA